MKDLCMHALRFLSINSLQIKEERWANQFGEWILFRNTSLGLACAMVLVLFVLSRQARQIYLILSLLLLLLLNMAPNFLQLWGKLLVFLLHLRVRVFVCVCIFVYLRVCTHTHVRVCEHMHVWTSNNARSLSRKHASRTADASHKNVGSST